MKRQGLRRAVANVQGTGIPGLWSDREGNLQHRGITTRGGRTAFPVSGSTIPRIAFDSVHFTCISSACNLRGQMKAWHTVGPEMCKHSSLIGYRALLCNASLRHSSKQYRTFFCRHGPWTQESSTPTTPGQGPRAAEICGDNKAE